MTINQYRALKKTINGIKKKYDDVSIETIVNDYNIKLKTSLDAEKDFKGDSPLKIGTKSVLAFGWDEFIIYYDEKDIYYKYYIAVMLVRYLMDTINGDLSEKEMHYRAHIGAAMLLAPKHAMRKNKISLSELSEKYGIEPSSAGMYWDIIHNTFGKRMTKAVQAWKMILFSV